MFLSASLTSGGEIQMGFRCVSEDCYGSVYGSEALEEGEIDVSRGRDFKQCVINKFKERLQTLEVKQEL